VSEPSAGKRDERLADERFLGICKAGGREEFVALDVADCDCAWRASAAEEVCEEDASVDDSTLPSAHGSSCLIMVDPDTRRRHSQDHERIAGCSTAVTPFRRAMVEHDPISSV
jgi:hypothetical protein